MPYNVDYTVYDVELTWKIKLNTKTINKDRDSQDVCSQHVPRLAADEEVFV